MHLELCQSDEFHAALRTRLSYGQAVVILSALASLAKDRRALAGKDWVSVEPLAGGPPGVSRVIVRDGAGPVWSAFVIYVGEALVALTADAGAEPSTQAMLEMDSALAAAVAEFKRRPDTD